MTERFYTALLIPHARVIPRCRVADEQALTSLTPSSWIDGGVVGAELMRLLSHDQASDAVAARVRHRGFRALALQTTRSNRAFISRSRSQRCPTFRENHAK